MTREFAKNNLSIQTYGLTVEPFAFPVFLMIQQNKSNNCKNNVSFDTTESLKYGFYQGEIKLKTRLTREITT